MEFVRELSAGAATEQKTTASSENGVKKKETLVQRKTTCSHCNAVSRIRKIVRHVAREGSS
jgi:hypothetical protein